jgi:Ca-activated chloride channel family protein
LEFKYPLNSIYFLIPILVLILLILGYGKKEKIMNTLRISTRIRFKVSRVLFITLGLCLMVFSLLGPQSFQGFTEVKKTGMDIYVLIDTSKSMLVEDIKPNRISRAKKIIEGIIDNLKGDRIGFIPFSSDAYIQMPLTDDYRLAKMFLDVVDTDMIGGGGTNIGAAIKLANDSFQRTSSADRVIIVLSDGEEHDSGSLETLKKIKDKDIKIFTIGIGTEKGGLIPVYDAKNEKRIGYKKDDNGNFITSHLKPDMLKKISDFGNGCYYHSSLSGDEIDLLLKDISSLKRDTLTTKKIRKFRQYYQYFLGIGILLFLTACLLPERGKME